MASLCDSVSMRSALKPIIGEEECYIGKALPPDESPSALGDISYESSVGFKSYAWVDEHPEEKSGVKRGVLEKVIEKIKLVRRDTFVATLKASTESARDQLALLDESKEFRENRDAVVLVEKHKSNQWVAELAIEHCNFVGNTYMTLGSKDATLFKAYIDKNPGFKRALKDKTVVLFDDASFSGKQLHDHVSAIRSFSIKNRLEIKAIAVIAPFMTASAYERIKSLSIPECPVIVGRPEPIETLGDTEGLSEPDKTSLCALWGYERGDLAGLGLTWFSHKVPNYQSFPKELAEGSIYRKEKTCLTYTQKFIPDIISPYKRDSYRFRPEVNLFNPEKLRSLEDSQDKGKVAASEILGVRSIAQMHEMIAKLGTSKDETLIFSDIDDTLISKSTKELVEGETTLNIFKLLQENYRVYCSTARDISSGETTFCQLASKGIELEKGNKGALRPYVISLGSSGSYLYKGIIYSAPESSSGKGDAILHLLTFPPFYNRVNHVFMIDDKEAELIKVQTACRVAGVNFMGFLLRS
jgi:hypothetical protein